MQKLTPKQQAFRKNLLTKIHLASRYVNYYKDNKDVYRDMLELSFNKRTAADLTINQLLLLLDFLQGKTQGIHDGISTQQEAYIKQRWQRLARNASEAALMEFIKNNTGEVMLNLRALTKTQARGVMAALNRMGES